MSYMLRTTKRKSGAILVLTAFLSVFILGITAVVVDIGYLYYKRNGIQTAVNAAWLAGNDRLMRLKSLNPVLTEEDNKSIKKHIIEVMKYNGFEENEENSFNININNDNNLQIVSKSHVGLFFAKIIEIDSTTIAASRNSNSTNAGNADILPIVISHGITKWNADNNLTFQFFSKDSGFIPGNEYIIKPGQNSESSILCQGITDFSPTGKISKEDYINNLSYGYTKALNINDKVSLLCSGYLNETEYALLSRQHNEKNQKVIIPIVELSQEASDLFGLNKGTFPIYNLVNNNNISISNAARIIGFAQFEILNESEYQRIDDNYMDGDEGSLGKPMKGQIRGKFIGYLVKPYENSIL